MSFSQYYAQVENCDTSGHSASTITAATASATDTAAGYVGCTDACTDTTSRMIADCRMIADINSQIHQWHDQWRERRREDKFQSI